MSGGYLLYQHSKGHLEIWSYTLGGVVFRIALPVSGALPPNIQRLTPIRLIGEAEGESSPRGACCCPHPPNDPQNLWLEPKDGRIVMRDVFGQWWQVSPLNRS